MLKRLLPFMLCLIFGLAAGLRIEHGIPPVAVASMEPCRTVTPEEFGAVGDGIHNDTAALQAANAAALPCGRIRLEGRTYYITSSISAPREIKVMYNAYPAHAKK